MGAIEGVAEPLENDFDDLARFLGDLFGNGFSFRWAGDVLCCMGDFSVELFDFSR